MVRVKTLLNKKFGLVSNDNVVIKKRESKNMNEKLQRKKKTQKK